VLLRFALPLMLVALACSSKVPPILAPNQNTPHLTLPVPVAEGHGEPVPAELPETAPGPSASAGARAVPSTPKQFSSDPPDPLPLRQAEQYEYTFHYEHGAIELVGVRPVRYPKPIVTARRMGRFAVELWIGHELVDRVRFDFPLLAADEPKTGPRPLGEKPGMQGGSFTTTVLVPAATRARSARLVDRALRTQAELVWPPEPAGLGPTRPMAPPGNLANDAPAVPVGAAAAPNDEGSSPSTASPSAAPSSATPASAKSRSSAAKSATPPSSAAPPAASPARAHPR